MEFVFTPAICKDRKETKDSVEREVKAFLKGTVTIRLPTFDEKMDMSDQGVADGDSSGNETQKNIRRMRSLVKLSEPHYRAVNVDRADGSKAYRSLDDLKEDPATHPILQEVVERLVGGGFEGND